MTAWPYALAAEAVVVLHLLFIGFVVLGAALLPRWPCLVWLHVPALLWGMYVEASGSPCPLTPLENHLRALAGARGYGGGFIEHYLLPLMYPAGLTRELQWMLALGVAGVNVGLYGWWVVRRKRPR
ncbi:DUF2784 domain-containing protein [uncultured Azohydromonas sp.]|jgi:Protein of Unknown function (DUF2784).|uniref:DUF2784 domain-containing protein n=1 Tax=uncultured Azohydromonas sp. TaxID=487342 RepID=UPI002620CB28|nr:DUF2784 domain-containing protein [uncultured Azohydromonas sp.]